MSFAALKKSSYFDNLKTEIEKISNPQGQSYTDDRLWKAELDKSGNGYAVIRFLPPSDGEDLPFAKVWSHAFKGPTGQWYIENSLTTIGKDDPVGAINRDLWNSGLESDKQTARNQKRKLSYYSNIYVVKDPLHPENEGKVFLFKYGKKIFDKIVEAAKPQFEDERPVDVFNFWQGANFKLKIVKKDGFWNYDKSEFQAPSALYEADEVKLEATYNQMFDLGEFTAPTSFKPYDELKGRLEVVLGTAVGANAVAATANISQTAEENVGRSAPEPEIVSSPAPAVGTEDDEDDTLSYFAKMAQED